MANYETLADGGHEHLIATVKPLVDQKANEHDIDVSVKELVENQPRGQLTGEILTTSHAYDMPPVSLTVDGKSTQDGTPTPESPVEIVSVENLALTFAGKNLLNIADWELDSNSGITLIEDGTAFRVAQQSYQERRNRFYPPFAANYTLSFDYETVTLSNENARTNLMVYKADGTTAGTSIEIRLVAVGHKAHVVGNVPMNAAYFAFGNWGQSGRIIVRNLQLELGSTATIYQPYDGTSVLLNLTQALRSLPDGTKDTLALTYLRPSTREGWAWYLRKVTRRVTTEVIDGSETDWWKSTSYAGGYYRRAWASSRGIARTTNHLQDRFVTATSTGNYAVGTCLIDESLNFRVDNDLYPTLADFKAWLVENPVTIQYPLATPTTETLDPIELPHMPLGDVTIWSDPTTGLTVNYIVEGKAIEETLETGIANALGAIATVETSPTTYNHAVGSRIVYDEVLYRVTSAIASGEDIVPGTNVEATTVTDEIKRLQQ